MSRLNGGETLFQLLHIIHHSAIGKASPVKIRTQVRLGFPLFLFHRVAGSLLGPVFGTQMWALFAPRFVQGVCSTARFPVPRFPRSSCGGSAWLTKQLPQDGRVLLRLAAAGGRRRHRG